MSETCISVKHATKSYAGRKVVDDLSLEVKKGEVFGMQLVAGYMPLGVGIRLMKAASVGAALGTMGTEITILGLIAVICIAISVKTFRWE